MKKDKLNLILATTEVAILKRVAKITGLSIDQVCNVLIAFGIVRAQEAGLLPKKKKKK
jgi:hypothetical protein